MTETYKIKQGDLQRSLRFVLTDADGVPVTTLASAVSIRFSMRPAGSVTPTINARPATVVDAATGTIEVDLSGTDTAAVGLYLGEVLVEWTAGEVQTYPSDGSIEIYIEADLSETPPRTQARLRVETAAATASDPVLDAAVVAQILDRARRADPDGRGVNESGWVETYDVDYAIVEAWATKAAEAACRVDLARGSLRIQRSQILENCLRMHALALRGVTSSAAMVGPNGRKVEGVLVVNGPDDVDEFTMRGAGGLPDREFA